MNSAEFVYSRITEGIQVVAPGIQKIIDEGNQDGSLQVAFLSKQLKLLQCFLTFG